MASMVRVEIPNWVHAVDGGSEAPGEDGWLRRLVTRRLTGRAAAVAVLFGGGAGPGAVPPADAYLLLVGRSTSMRYSPGDISFPGGGLEPGETLVAGMLRELDEETGIGPDDVVPLQVLRERRLGFSPYRVRPVLAYHRGAQDPVADAGETVSVHRVRVADLVDPGNRTAVRLRVGGFTMVQMPVFEVPGLVIWGYTAMVLAAILGGSGWERQWTPDGRFDIRIWRPGDYLNVRRLLVSTRQPVGDGGRQ